MPSARFLLNIRIPSASISVFRDSNRKLRVCPAPMRRRGAACCWPGTADDLAGVVGIWSLGSYGASEMKRLYVRPPWRGIGLGRRLAEAAVEAARKAGYRSICLDTLEFMTKARSLYKDMGFAEIPAYYDNPLEGVVFMERSLD